MTMTKESAQEGLNTIIANPKQIIEVLGWDEQQFAMHLTVLCAIAGKPSEEIATINNEMFEKVGFKGLDDPIFLDELLKNIKNNYYPKEAEHGTATNV